MNATFQNQPAGADVLTEAFDPGSAAEPRNLPDEAVWIAGSSSQEIALLADPNGRQSEATRALRTHILTSHRQRGRRALVVCAASRGEGCTSVAVNLAVALRQAGLKVLLIDADLRHPSLHHYFPPAWGAPGLHERLLAPETPLTRSIIRDAATGLSIMPAGKVTTDAPNLLFGDRLKPLLDVCQREFDATIIDTPPANSCSDARLISSIAGYSLIVAKRDASFLGDVKTLADELRRANAHVVGAVLNDA